MTKTIHNDGWQMLKLRTRGLVIEVLESFCQTLAADPEPIGVEFRRYFPGKPLLEFVRESVLDVATSSLVSQTTPLWHMDAPRHPRAAWIYAHVEDKSRMRISLVAAVRKADGLRTRRVKVNSLANGNLDRLMINQMGWAARVYLEA